MGEGEFFTARIAGTDYALQGSPMPRAARKSIGLLAGDIVNQCNLRCPFCIVDYSNVPGLNMMSHQIYKKMIELLPKIATPGNLWFSCLHEPTMHTQFIDFVEEVPDIFRDRISFTTNLSRRMDPSGLTLTFLSCSRDVDDNSCSHNESLDCFGRFGNCPNESDH
jgi:sulfatase maturation enzyme AslB (radical SAM superfamily)